MRTGLALLATIVCSVLATLNFVVFGILVVTKFVILYSNPRSILAIVIFGGNAFALGWLTVQASRALRRQAA